MPQHRVRILPFVAEPCPSEAPTRDGAAGCGTELLGDNHGETPELGELAKLPPFRPVVISLLRLFDRADVDIQQVSSLVEADPSLASEILDVVNSPLFAVWEKVSHPSHAIALLGAERTKSLAATLALRSLLAGGPRTPMVRRFWIHSLATATIARHLAPAFHLAPEHGHVTALLHDLGRSGLLAAYPERYAALARLAYGSTAEILDAEVAEFGMTHCHAGGLLAHAWQLPPIFEEVAEGHHQPGSHNPLVSLVQLSCRLADDLMYQAIHRCDAGRPEHTVAQHGPEEPRLDVADCLTTVGAAIDLAIQGLDF